MKCSDMLDINNGLKILNLKKNTYSEVISAIEDSKLRFDKNNTQEIKRKISENFNNLGWTERVKLGNSRLTISFIKNRVGICFQIGNVARTYADLLKLMYLHNKKIIDVGVMIIPDKLESKQLGANYAQFERLRNEIIQFKNIIKAPITLIGLKNK
jgi:hypothetical protein